MGRDHSEKQFADHEGDASAFCSLLMWATVFVIELVRDAKKEVVRRNGRVDGIFPVNLQFDGIYCIVEGVSRLVHEADICCSELILTCNLGSIHLAQEYLGHEMIKSVLRQSCLEMTAFYTPCQRHASNMPLTCQPPTNISTNRTNMCEYGGTEICIS